MLKFAITNPRTLLLGVIAEPLKFHKQSPIPSMVCTSQVRVMLSSSGQLSQSAGSERKEKNPTSQSCLAIQGFIFIREFLLEGVREFLLEGETQGQGSNSTVAFFK